MAMKSQIAGVIVGALLVVAPLAGCAADEPETAAPESRVPSAAELDNYRPGDLAFFNELKLHGALTFAPPADLAVAARQSTAVVVADVVDVRHTRTIVGDTPSDQVPKIGVVLRPVEVLHGKLRPELAEVVVEFILPEGNLANEVAAFAQGADRVVGAVADDDVMPGRRTMQTDGERFGKLSELVAHVRDLD